ncbi:hypothetical protein S83_033954, partial [Arachis hypogaea]
PPPPVVLFVRRPSSHRFDSSSSSISGRCAFEFEAHGADSQPRLAEVVVASLLHRWISSHASM